MNAFEDIVRKYLEEKGYWVRQCVKVSRISKEDKRKLKNPSMPTPEIDIVALNVKKNELLLVEVKSYLDSYGVYYEAVSGEVSDTYKKDAKGYKLFNDGGFREIATDRLKEEFLDQGLINKGTKINYALAAGHIHYPEDELKIKDHFLKQKEKWILFPPEDIKDIIRKLSEKSWEDNVVTMTAKLTKEATT